MKNPFALVDVPDAGLPSESVATNVTSLLAAASFVEPFSGRRDPRADRVFEILATEYSCGGHLILPVPKETPGEGGFFLDLWAKETPVTQLPFLEVTDSGFEEMSRRLAPTLSDFVEGDAVRVLERIHNKGDSEESRRKPERYLPSKPVN